MSNRNIEATLRLSAKLGPTGAFGQMAGKLRQLELQSNAVNKSQMMQAKAFQLTSGALMRFAGPAAMGLAAMKIGEAASNMEDRLFSLQKKTGASAEQIAQLRDEMKGLGRQVPVSLDEIGAAFERGGAAGIPLDELKEFAKLTVQVSDAWDMSAESVANAFAGFEAGMGVARPEMKAYADLINYLADQGIADESGIVDFIDRAGASLKLFGLGREQIAAYGATMLNLKMPADVAANAMGTLTGALAAPENLSKKSRGALREIVGDLGKFAKKVEKEPVEALDDFWNGLEKFDNAGRIRVLGALLGAGFDDEMARLSGGISELRRNLGLAKNVDAYLGSIDAAGAKKTGLWSSQVKIFTNNLEAIGDAVGSPALGKLNELLTAGNDYLDRNAAISAGRDKAALPGQTWDDVRAEYDRRFEMIHGNLDGVREAYLSDLEALGRDQIKSLFANLSSVAASKRAQEIVRAAAGQYNTYQPGKGGGDFTPLPAGKKVPRQEIPIGEKAPLPTARPSGGSEADQRNLYSAAEAEARQDAARRRMAALGSVDDGSAGFNVFAGVEDRLNMAAQSVQSSADNLNKVSVTVLEDRATRFRPPEPSIRNRVQDAGGVVRNTYDRFGSEPMPDSTFLRDLVDGAARVVDALQKIEVTTGRSERLPAGAAEESLRVARELDAMMMSGGNLIQQAGDAGQSIEVAAQSINENGVQAGQSIQAGGDAASAALNGAAGAMAAVISGAIIQAITSGSGQLASSIRGALAQGTTVRFNGSPAMQAQQPSGGRNRGTSMPDAGVAKRAGPWWANE